MAIYEHRQVGVLVLSALGVSAVATAILFVLVGVPTVVAGSVLGILLLCLVLFSSLAVEVTADRLTASFGPGVIRRSFRIADIRGARIVRNRWYYGWGIRLTPHGWMFNVSGLDAVELDLTNNRRFRIGTDEPQRLLAAIRQAAGLAG